MWRGTCLAEASCKFLPRRLQSNCQSRLEGGLEQWFSTGNNFVPSGGIWQSLEIFLTVMTGKRVLLASSR